LKFKASKYDIKSIHTHAYYGYLNVMHCTLA